MEILKREIKAERQENQGEMSASLINGRRLSCRWRKKEEHPFTEEELKKLKERFEGKRKKEEEEGDKDLVINFTEEETKRIRETIRGRDC
jgi:hypothetical protein